MAQIVTITNPLTGQPAKVDQLDHTAQQIDDGLNIARGVSNPNLLDNWYFGNPVDQRGGYVVPPGVAYFEIGTGTQIGTLSTYSNVVRFAVDGSTRFPIIKIGGVEYFASPTSEVRGYTGAGYGIDRWKLYQDTTITLADNGVVLTTDGGTSNYWMLSQAFENYKQLYGCAITFSAVVESLSGNTLRIGCYTGEKDYTADIKGSGVVQLTFTVPTSSSRLEFYIGRDISTISSITIKAAKLELGTTQTLAHQDENGNWALNEIPNYGEQFLRCVSSTADPSDTYANVPQRRNNRVIAVKTINGLTTTVYSNDVTVTVSIFGNPTEAINKGTALCDTLPVKYRPPIDYYVRSFYDDETSNVVGVNTTGLITNPIANLKAGAYHRAVLTYSI